MQPLLSWAESKIFGGLHIVLCGWILFTPRRMMWVMLLCFLLSPSILKTRAKTRRAKRSIATLTIKDWTGKPSSNDCFFAGLHPFQFPKQPLSDSQAVDGAAHLIRQEDANIRPQGTNKLGALETWQGGTNDPVGILGMWNFDIFWPFLTHAHIISYPGTQWHPCSWQVQNWLLNVEVEKAQMLRCYQVDSTDARQNPRTHWNHLLLKTPFRTAIYEKWPWNDVFGEHSHLDTRYGQIV